MGPLLVVIFAPAVLCLVAGFIGLVAMDRQEMSFKKRFGEGAQP